MAQLQISSLNCTSAATRNMVDGVAAGNLVENLLSLSLDDPRLVDEDNGFFPEDPDHGPLVIDGTGSTMAWEVQDNFADTGLKRIAVTIQWKDKRGRHRFAYESVRSDPKVTMLAP